MLAEAPEPLAQRPAAEVRAALQHHPRRLAAGVGVDDADEAHRPSRSSLTDASGSTYETKAVPRNNPGRFPGRAF